MSSLEYLSNRPGYPGGDSEFRGVEGARTSTTMLKRSGQNSHLVPCS